MAIVDRDGAREVVTVGSVDVEGTLFRFASITKAITAAAVLTLVDDGRLALGDPIGRRLPELAAPEVVRTPASPLDDVVPANRPITVYDVLTSQVGRGFASDFTLPAVRALSGVQGDGREVQSFARVSGRPFPEFLAERIFAPLGTTGTGFVATPGRSTAFSKPPSAGCCSRAEPACSRPKPSGC